MQDGSPVDNVAPAAPLSEIDQLRQEYASYRAKTNKWKTVVKTQLEEAAAKNAALRTELKESSAKAEANAAETRIQLTAEFKERTAMKAEQVETLTLKVAALQQKIITMIETNRSDTAAALQRQGEEFHVQKQAELDDAARKFESTLRALEQQVSKGETTTERLTQDNAVLTAKVCMLQNNIDERAKIDSAKTSQGQAAPNVDTAAAAEKLTNQLRQANLDLSNTQRELEKCQKDKILELEKLEMAKESEILKRSEQLLVLQTLLKQSQNDSSVFQLKLDRMQIQRSTTENALEEKISSLNHDLVQRVQLLDECKTKVSALEKNSAQLLEQVRLLEEESTWRERALSELMLDDDSRLLIESLTAAKEVALQDLDNALQKNSALLLSVDAMRDTLSAQSAELHQRELKLAGKYSEIDEKFLRLQKEEKRILEKQAQLSLQAQQFSAVVGSGGADSEANGGSNGHGDNSSDESYSLRSSIVNLQHHYNIALRQGGGSNRAAAGILFRAYRRLLPVVILAFLVFTMMYWWAFSPTSQKDKSMGRYSDMVEELGAMKREYQVLSQRLSRCCGEVANAVPLFTQKKNS